MYIHGSLGYGNVSEPEQTPNNKGPDICPMRFNGVKKLCKGVEALRSYIIRLKNRNLEPLPQDVWQT